MRSLVAQIDSTRGMEGCSLSPAIVCSRAGRSVGLMLIGKDHERDC